jgi:hypothetical protein
MALAGKKEDPRSQEGAQRREETAPRENQQVRQTQIVTSRRPARFWVIVEGLGAAYLLWRGETQPKFKHSPANFHPLGNSL